MGCPSRPNRSNHPAAHAAPPSRRCCLRCSCSRSPVAARARSPGLPRAPGTHPDRDLDSDLDHDRDPTPTEGKTREDHLPCRRLLLGPREVLRPDPRSHGHRGRLRERRLGLGDVRRWERLRRGGARRLRPVGRSAAVPAEDVLPRDRSDDGGPARQRRGHGVPQRHLLHRSRGSPDHRGLTGRLQTQFSARIAIETGPLKTYTRAEDYHQDYLQKNPGGYCHIPLGAFKDAAAARPEPSDFPPAE